MTDDTPPECCLHGPPPGQRHPVFGIEPADTRGHLRLVTHPVNKNVMYNKGAGVDQLTVPDLAGLPAGEGVTEWLDLVVDQANGARPNEMPWGGAWHGQCLSGAPVRQKPLPLGDRRCTERPQPGLNWWRIAGSPNRFHVIYGEHRKSTNGKMDKGIMRTASWRFRYRATRRTGGREVLLFERTIPGTFVMRSGCSQIDARNKKNKAVMNGRKRQIIRLLAESGVAGAANLSPKRSMQHLASLATAAGVSIASIGAAQDRSPLGVYTAANELALLGRRGCKRPRAL